MNFKGDKNIYTIPEVAEICSFSRITLWRWVKSGKLKSFKTPGGQFRIYKKDLADFARKNGMHQVFEVNPAEQKILIVEDDPSNQKFLEGILKSDGYQTQVASDGFDAGIKITTFKPDLVVLDLFMPKMDGFEVCRRIKNDPYTKNITVLVLTGYDTGENRDRIMKEGADGYIAKPVEIIDLLNHVRSLLTKNKLVF